MCSSNQQHRDCFTLHDDMCIYFRCLGQWEGIDIQTSVRYRELWISVCFHRLICHGIVLSTVVCYGVYMLQSSSPLCGVQAMMNSPGIGCATSCASLAMGLGTWAEPKNGRCRFRFPWSSGWRDVNTSAKRAVCMQDWSIAIGSSRFLHTLLPWFTIYSLSISKYWYGI